MALARLPALVFFEAHGQEVLRIDALAMRQRMLNSLLFVTEKAYQQDWTYQRFARSRAIAAAQARQNGE